MPGWWVTEWYQVGGIVLVGSWVFWVILSIVLHELSHGWAALRCGDRTPVESGHMTWNPMVHMGPMSLLVFALVGIAWGAMPVNPGRFSRRHDDALVSGAGPAMNLALAVVCVLIAGLWIAFAGSAAPQHVYANVRMFFIVGAALNIALMLFNLLPVPPLDGSRIVSSFVPAYERFVSTQTGAVVTLVLFVLLFMKAGGVIFGLAFDAAAWGVSSVVSVLTGGKGP